MSGRYDPEIKGFKNGDTVEGMTWGNVDAGMEPYRVRGTLTLRYVPTLDYWQYLVGDTGLNPVTVKKVDKSESN
jgi:hypothetical protein